MHYAGLNGMPRRIYTYAEGFGWESMNLLATIGYFVIVIGFLIFMHNFIRSARKGELARQRPVGCPHPGVEHLVAAARVQLRGSSRGARPGPILDYQARRCRQRRNRARRTHVDPSTIHMPSPSYWPLVAAFGLAWIAGGLLIDFGWDYIRFPISFVGGLITIIGVIGWSNEPPAAEHAAEGHY